jgi:hypothetical protein
VPQLPPHLFGMTSKMKIERRWDGEDDIAVQAQLCQSRRDVMCEGLARMDGLVQNPVAGVFVRMKIAHSLVPNGFSEVRRGNDGVDQRGGHPRGRRRQ